MPSIPFARRPLLRGLQGFSVLLLLAALAPARGDVSPEAPRANYKQALKYGKTNLDPLSYSTVVTPGWIGKTDTFWYSYRTSKGNSFWRVDPAKKSKTPLFDRDKLAAQLAELSRKPAEAINLPLAHGQVNEDGSTFSFVFSEMRYEYDLKAEKLVSKGKAPEGPGGFPGAGVRRRPTRRMGRRKKTSPSRKARGKAKAKARRAKAAAGLAAAAFAPAG